MSHKPDSTRLKLPYSGKFSRGPIFAEGQSSKISRSNFCEWPFHNCSSHNPGWLCRVLVSGRARLWMVEWTLKIKISQGQYACAFAIMSEHRKQPAGQRTVTANCNHTWMERLFPLFISLSHWHIAIWSSMSYRGLRRVRWLGIPLSEPYLQTEWLYKQVAITRIS